MSLEARRSLISKIEEHRGSRVLTYVTTERAPAGAQMANDAVRPVQDLLRTVGHAEKLDLFIYSRGGDIDVPWRMATALRQASDSWNILIPYAANSAATLLALGADEIVLGPNGELGPIDPQLTVQTGGTPSIQDQVGVEDVMSYVKFVRERAGLSDQASLSEALSRLAKRLDPISLGKIYRTHSHIREVASLMLRSQKEPLSEQKMGTIIETLAERVYAHGHAIGYSDAKAMGLQIVQAEGELDQVTWDLLQEYESEMKSHEPIDPRHVLEASGQDRYEEQVTLALIETSEESRAFGGNLVIEATREPVPQLSINVNLNLQMPPLPDPPPPNMDELIQAMMAPMQQQIAQDAQYAATEAVRSQSRIVSADISIRDARWRRVDS